MKPKAKEQAEEAAFQCFVNSYLREIEEGTVLPVNGWPEGISSAVKEVRELWLHCRSSSCLVELSYCSLAGRHTLGNAWQKQGNGQWRPMEKMLFLIVLIEELHYREKDFSHYEQLLSRVLESAATTERYVEYSERDLFHQPDTFIEGEQSLLFGHWMHPSPKSRYGMAYWQHQLYAPELKGRFQLHLFYAHFDWIEESAAGDLSVEAIIKEDFPDYPGYRAVPMHPLQAKWLLQQEWVAEALQNKQLLYEGAAGPFFTATSSVRTVYSEKSRWMFKFSLPVHITNSLRVNKRHELTSGISMVHLAEKLAVTDHWPSFQMIKDPAYITIGNAGQPESGFEVIIRENPFISGKDRSVFSVAALVQEQPYGKESVLTATIKRLAAKEHLDLNRAAMNWFRRYWETAIEPLLAIYDRYGIALEAHQQNSLLYLEEDWPALYYYRDNQGFYLSKDYQKGLAAIEPSLKQNPFLFYEDSLIQERFFYYLFINQLFAVVHRMGADQLITEDQLLDWTAQRLADLKGEMTGAGNRFIDYILKEKEIACKANLLTRLQDVDELEEELEQAVYTQMKNPLSARFYTEKGEQYEAALL
mgnify:CR=1 FL=1